MSTSTFMGVPEDRTMLAPLENYAYMFISPNDGQAIVWQVLGENSKHADDQFCKARHDLPVDLVVTRFKVTGGHLSYSGRFRTKRADLHLVRDE